MIFLINKESNSMELKVFNRPVENRYMGNKTDKMVKKKWVYGWGQVTPVNTVDTGYKNNVGSK